MKAANRTRRFTRLLAGAITAAAIFAVNPASADTGYEESAAAPFQNSNQLEDCRSYYSTANCSARAKANVNDGRMVVNSSVKTNNGGLTPGSGWSNGTADLFQTFYVPAPVSRLHITAVFELDSASVDSSVPSIGNTGRQGFVELRLSAVCDGDCLGDSVQTVATIKDGNVHVGRTGYALETEVANSDGSPVQGYVYIWFDLTAYANVGQLGVGAVDAAAHGHLLSIEARSF